MIGPVSDGVLVVVVSVPTPVPCAGSPALHHPQIWKHRRRLLLPSRERLMGKIIVIALTLMFAATANAGSRCERYPDNIARCLVPVAGPEASTIESKWRVGEDVLCCCKTFSGGECCARVAVCAGKIPGE